jgi:sugar/nucleoside kinase (ribokinase family)
MPNARPYALLAAGELLVDFIGQHPTPFLQTAHTFGRVAGGSPANLATNLAKLGHPAALVACVGSDGLGEFLKASVAAAGLDAGLIATDPHEPTSLVVVNRTTGTPDFVAYRTADRMLHPSHLPDALLDQYRLFHTTCFALSRDPARTTLLDAARRTAARGGQLSIDANYAPSLWPDRAEARRVLAAYVAPGALVKLSTDDAERLYGEPVADDRILQEFHAMGAPLVVLTKGAEGSLISWDHGQEWALMPGERLDVVDATGAGDAYWAGFLSAWLDGRSIPLCARTGARLAARKLTTSGPLPAGLDRTALYV